MEYTEENYTKAKPNDEFDFICKKCGKHFTRTKREISKSKGAIPQYCSLECSRTQRELGYIEVTCLECGKKKLIRISEYNKSDNKNFFCDKKCAAKYNNHKYPKRVKQEKSSKKNTTSICPICGGKKHEDSAKCQKCENKIRRDAFHNRKLGDFIGYGTKEKYLTVKCSQIRKDARNVLNESNKPHECAYCHNHEFDAILELHHIRSITDFPPETLIGEVNALGNLVWLCPNHHALLHLGLISLDDNKNKIIEK